MRVVGFGGKVPNYAPQLIQIILHEYANMSFGDGLARTTGATQFTLLGPDGPIERQITVAMSSKDSFATCQNDQLTVFVYFVKRSPKAGLSFLPT